jgi:hypothetical protein
MTTGRIKKHERHHSDVVVQYTVVQEFEQSRQVEVLDASSVCTPWEILRPPEIYFAMPRAKTIMAMVAMNA